MKITHITMRKISAALLLSALPVATAFAGGPLNLNPNDPDNFTRWANAGQNIPYNPDLGALGPLDNSAAVQGTNDAFQAWQDIPTSTSTYVNNGQLDFDVDVTNFAPFVDNLFNGANNADGISPIVYDADGSIFLTLFGQSGVLGFASQDTFDENGVPIEGVSFLNGGSILGGFPEEDFFAVQVHEFGHYSGLGHTNVNGQNIGLGDASGPTPNNDFGDAPSDQVETMYPFAIRGGGQATPHADDIAFLSTLYPAPGFFESNGSISGTIFGSDGTTPLVGVNVIARNVEDPFVDAVSAISGDRGIPGEYTINGLTPGASYVVFTDRLLQGAFSTPALAFTAVEEYYNGANESIDPTIDDPAERSEIPVSAGETVSGISISFNGIAQNAPLPLGDDASLQIFLPFDVTLCGISYNSVFINSNGSLSFGAPATSAFPSAAAMLSGPARIAGVWDDLDPTAGGSVQYSADDNNFTASWIDVPEFLGTEPNSFSISLRKNLFGEIIGNFWTVEYGSISTLNGLAGYSCGGRVTSGFETPTDVSALGTLVVESLFETAVFEQFIATAPVDLADSQQKYFGTRAFRDSFESNDTVNSARRIALPFNSQDNDTTYTKIDSAGEDVDYFRFNAQGGQTLVAEIVTSAADTTLGLFNSEGTLIAVDDDGGLGTLSRVVFEIPEDGRYFIAVSAFPDLIFNGAGADFGRYVLNVELIDGTILTLGDDDSVEVNLGFDFPYQGVAYSSVFVNSNGNLTFGSGDTAFTESAAALVNGAPRIAPLWDDLSPNAGGLVLLKNEGDSSTISFQNVPEFFSPGGNSFDVTLHADGNIDIRYGALTAIDGLAGISQGNDGEDPGPIDLSEANIQSAAGTVYELFDFVNINDLAETDLMFVIDEE